MEVDENNNSASRARWILLNASHEHHKKSVLEAWANVLSPDHGENIDHFEIVKLIQALRDEIKATKAEAEKCKIPTNLYEHHIDKALEATQVENLTSQWITYRQFITPDLLLCFSFCAFIFGVDEFSFDEEDIEEIQKLISELELQVDDGAIDPVLKHFVTTQIKTLKHSLNEYRIKGAKAFKSAYVNGVVQVFENEELIKGKTDLSEINLLRKVWEKMKMATEKAASTNKAIDTWVKLIEKGSEVIEHLS